MHPASTPTETPSDIHESSVVADAALRIHIRGRGQDALFESAPVLPLAAIAVLLQSFALRQIERVERPGEPDDIRCNDCLQTWVEYGVDRMHLESCPVGRALHLARLIINSLPAGEQITTYPLTDAVREIFTHQQRTALVAAQDPFAGAGRIHEVEPRTEIHAGAAR